MSLISFSTSRKSARLFLNEHYNQTVKPLTDHIISDHQKPVNLNFLFRIFKILYSNPN